MCRSLHFRNIFTFTTHTCFPVRCVYLMLIQFFFFGSAQLFIGCASGLTIFPCYFPTAGIVRLSTFPTDGNISGASVGCLVIVAYFYLTFPFKLVGILICAGLSQSKFCFPPFPPVNDIVKGSYRLVPI